MAEASIESGKIVKSFLPWRSQVLVTVRILLANRSLPRIKNFMIPERLHLEELLVELGTKSL
jgi:hypothetical protein